MGWLRNQNADASYTAELLFDNPCEILRAPAIHILRHIVFFLRSSTCYATFPPSVPPNCREQSHAKIPNFIVLNDRHALFCSLAETLLFQAGLHASIRERPPSGLVLVLRCPFMIRSNLFVYVYVGLPWSICFHVFHFSYLPLWF